MIGWTFIHEEILACLIASAWLLAGGPKRPKLVLAIILDQFRYDYTTRFRSGYTGGFERLLTRARWSPMHAMSISRP